jgi:hypothetical protein
VVSTAVQEVTTFATPRPEVDFGPERVEIRIEGRSRRTLSEWCLLDV